MWIRLVIAFFAKKIYKHSFIILKLKIEGINSKIIPVELIKSNQILEKFLISGEDHRFKYHIEFDIVGMLRAVRNRLLYEKIEGASTIEQQLVRVLLNDFERSFKRKIREIFLSTTIANIIPKNKIPLIYLRVAFFGTNMIGIDQVLYKFKMLDKEIITKEIAAEIISRIKYPEPKLYNQKRFAQIEMRKKHLLILYQRHSLRKIFTIYG